MIQLKNPVHPGEVLRHQVVDAHELTIGQAAQALGVGPQVLSAVLKGKAQLSPEMATRFEKAFGIDLATLLRMQTSYDIAQARWRAGSIDVKPYRAERKTPPPELAS